MAGKEHDRYGIHDNDAQSPDFSVRRQLGDILSHLVESEEPLSTQTIASILDISTAAQVRSRINELRKTLEAHGFGEGPKVIETVMEQGYRIPPDIKRRISVYPSPSEK